MEVFKVRRGHLLFGFAAKNIGGGFQQLLFPVRDLVGMNIELFSQLGQCPVAPDRRQGHFGLEARCVIPSGSSHVLAPVYAVRITAWVEQGYHLSHCPVLGGHFFQRP